METIKDQIITKQDELIASFVNRLNYNYSDIDLWSRMNCKLRSELNELKSRLKDKPDECEHCTEPIPCNLECNDFARQSLKNELIKFLNQRDHDIKLAIKGNEEAVDEYLKDN